MSQELLPAYLIVGADEVKRDSAVKKLKARLESTGMADFNLDERDMSKVEDVESVISSLNTYPLGSDFRLVILTECDRLAKSVSEPLVEYLAAPCETTVCLIIAKTLAKNTRLYKAVAKIGTKAVIDCSTKKRWEVPKVVVSMAQKRGLTIDHAAAEELVSRAGESTRMLDNELGRIAEQRGVTHITLADVEATVARTAEVQPWDLLNAVSARDVRKTLELFELMPEKNYVWLFTLLVGRVRELICAKALDARGQGSSLAQSLGMQSWQVKNHLAWARKFTMDELTSALRDAVQVECAVKGSRDTKTALTTWILKIAVPEARR